MTEIDGLDGEGEHRRGLEGTVSRITRKLRGGGFPAIHTYYEEDGSDIPEDATGIWLPAIEGEEKPDDLAAQDR